MDADRSSEISAFLSHCVDHQLFQLTKFYRDRLEQAIEEGVEELGLMLTGEDHFTGREHHSVTELAEKGNRAGASELLLDLVMEKGSGTRRVMWESFVKLHHHLPKLNRILKEIQERGDAQFAYMDTERGLSEVPTHLKGVQRKHKETLRAQTEELRVNTILMSEKENVFQLVDRYAELTVISTVRDRRLVEHELLARGRVHEEWREKHLRRELEKIRIAHLFQILGPFFTQNVTGTQRIPNTITQLYSYYIYSILKNHGREIENPRDVLLRVGLMAFRGVSEKKIVFTGGDLINYDLQPSQFLSGFLMELLEREDSARSVVYTFPHLTIQEFVAAVAQFLNPHPGDILKSLSEAHNTTDGRFEVFLRFVAGLSSPMTARGLEDFLGPFPHETTCRVIDWVKEEFQRQSGITESEAGKRSLLNTLHYLFESQNSGLAQATLGSVETLSFSGMTLTPIDCAVLSHVIGLCDTIKHLDLEKCNIQCEEIQRLVPGLHKCQELRVGRNELGDAGVKLVSAVLRNPECKIQKLWLNNVGLTDSGAEDLASALSTIPSLTELNLSENELGNSGVKLVSAVLRNTECKIQTVRLFSVGLTDSGAEDLVSALITTRSLTDLDLSVNKLGDSGVKLVSEALKNPECKIQKLWLSGVRLTDSGVEDLVSAIITNGLLTRLNLGSNWLTDRSVPALRRLILAVPSLERIVLVKNRFSQTGEKELRALQEPRPGLSVVFDHRNM
ncbi:NACHT, LRR and PYD domains-containing protein 3-like [Hemitrygon akajei]|uniref:NACHT, LRR and PYD domains-containing protein 3-like n=1 Tax=Hemitrygon akajei TaxID=2704970 RepID=UPI003BF97C77